MGGFWATQTHLTSSVVTAPIVLETRCWRAQWSSVAGAKPREGRKGVLERCWRPQRTLGLNLVAKGLNNGIRIWNTVFTMVSRLMRLYHEILR